MAFADKLRSLREAANLTQYELAKRAGLSKQALSRLELGEREPRWGTVQALAQALGVSVGDFAEPVASPPSEPAEPPSTSPKPTKAKTADRPPSPPRRRRKQP
jgi:transcriptional regulator with XRE-family HTH domain